FFYFIFLLYYNTLCYVIKSLKRKESVPFFGMEAFEKRKAKMKKRRFQRIGLLNRGEPAVRFIQAIRDMNREEGYGFKIIAFYTYPDENSLFTSWADEICLIGPPQFEDPNDLDEFGKPRRKSSYLNYPFLQQKFQELQIEAVWPGWGFAAEDPQLVEICEKENILFIGPSSEVMRRLGDKISSKIIAEKAGAPVTPWSGKALESCKEAQEIGRKLGYPLALKASAGGGGRGIRLVFSEEELVEVFDSAKSEALKAFGDDRMFLEKMVPKARHIEVQIGADHYGTIHAFGVRDCSVQRRNQKIIEEGPSPVLSKDQEERICQAAVSIAKEAGYTNLGTVEFLLDASTKEVYFMEMNTRLQVEHPVTEMITGLDLVKLQVKIAMGESLPKEKPSTRGHAIEVRLNAEDGEQNFAPTPGKVLAFQVPTGPGIRCDTGIREGDMIPMDFDSMVAKIIGYGATREEARARLDRALTESVVLVGDGTADKGYLLEILRNKEFQEARVTTGW
ncbi:MAG: ATP-grasp domain-containing protein, partial [Planctomycetota bacterium]